LGAALFFAGGGAGEGVGRLRSSTIFVGCLERGTQWIAKIA
jgi:hypothetical protein